MPRTLMYWIGILGLPGSGPSFMCDYDASMTLGKLAQLAAPTLLYSDPGKTIKFFKYVRGDVNKYNPADPYWSEDTTLQTYTSYYGGVVADNWVIYVLLSK